MTRNERLAAAFDGTFVVFMIGMRINNPLLVHKWLPVAMAMPRMVKELYRHPEMGFIHAESWFARTTIMVQYWRSLDQLLSYARNKETEHLPAWRAFNKAVGTDGSVGIWHETYVASPGSYENIYVNIPPFGLGQVGYGVSRHGRQAIRRVSYGRARAYALTHNIGKILRYGIADNGRRIVRRKSGNRAETRPAARP